MRKYLYHQGESDSEDDKPTKKIKPIVLIGDNFDFFEQSALTKTPNLQNLNENEIDEEETVSLLLAV
jgi:hypothetical protein